MAYQLGALIGALGGGGPQQVTTATARLFGTTWTFARVGNIVQVSTGEQLNSNTGGSIPSNMRPATDVMLEVYAPGATKYPTVVINTAGIASTNSYNSEMSHTVMKHFCYLAA